jgi:tyrosine-protein kinase Etk/Wzc
MSETNSYLNTATEDEINLKEVIQKYLSHWKWILFSVFVFAVLGYIYVRSQVNIYQSEAKVLVKDTRKGGLSMDLDIFSDLGIGGANTNVYNEIEAFNTRTLLREVVKGLELQESLRLLGGIAAKDVLFYKNAPFKTSISTDALRQLEKVVSFEVKILDGERVQIKEIYSPSLGERVERDLAKAKWNQELESVLGKIALIRDLSVDLHPGDKFLLRLNTIDGVVDEIRANLSVEAVSKDVSVISIKHKGPINELNNDIINNLIHQHEQRTVRDKNEITLATSEFIRERMLLIERELETVEDSSQAFKSKNRLIDVESDAAMFLTKESAIEKQITDAMIQLSIAGFMNEFIQQAKGLGELFPSNLGIDDQSIARLIEEHNKLVLERNRLLESSSAKNPKVIQLENQLQAIRESLKESLNKVQSSLEINLQALRKQEGQYKNQLANIPAFEREYREILRQQQIKETLYLYLLQKREENEIAMASTLGSVKVLDEAYPAKEPVAPKKKIIFLGAVLLGLILPIGIIYVLDIMDTKVKRREELEQLGIPFLGEIPYYKGDKSLVAVKGERSSTAEALRMLRTNMDFLLSEVSDRGKVVFVTSTIAGEGKTFMALNLASSLALTDKKVVVLGMDLRAPKLAKYTNIPNSTGVSDYLVNENITIEQITHQVKDNQLLDMILSGSIPPNPSELLFLPRMNEIFEQLQAKYDYIIVDSAPVGLVVDTVSMLHKADLLLYVVRYNYLERDALQLPKNLVKDKKVKRIATLFNATDNNSLNYAGYGYGYGYIQSQQPWYKKLIKKNSKL